MLRPEDYLGLVHRVARRVHAKLPRHVELDELVSLGTLGLFDALAKYDPAKGQEFATYAYWRIRGAILDGLRAEGFGTRRTGWTPMLPLTDQDIPGRSDQSAGQRQLDLLVRLCQGLAQDRKFLVVVLRYFLGLRLKDVAEVLGVSEERASNLHRDALRKLRRQQEDD